jgi:hypothetical protein
MVCARLLFARGSSLLLVHEKGRDWRGELVTAVEEAEFEDEEVSEDLTTELLDKGSSGGSGTTCRYSCQFMFMCEREGAG